MKTTLLKLSLFIALVCNLSCQSEYDQDFDLALKNDNVVLINSTTRSCTLQIGDPNFTQGSDVTAMYTSFGGFKIRWRGKNPLHLEYIEVTFKGPAVGGKKVVTLAGTDLAYIWSGGTLLKDIQSGDETTSFAECNLVVGGITLTDTSRSWNDQGTFLVYATTQSEDGKGVVPVIASVNFNYSYTGH